MHTFFAQMGSADDTPTSIRAKLQVVSILFLGIFERPTLMGAGPCPVGAFVCLCLFLHVRDEPYGRQPLPYAEFGGKGQAQCQAGFKAP